MEHIVVIGGGLSGLATAFNLKYLAQQNNRALHVSVIEKEPTVGGKIRSYSDNGYLCEWGPNGFLTNKQHTQELCKKLAIYNDLLASNDNARKRFVYSKSKLHKLPHNQMEFLTNSLISLSGKLRIAGELFVSAKKDGIDETLADFTRRRLGREALDKLIGPMASGIFAGNPETMSLQACFPRINQLETEYGGLLKAMLKLTKQHAKAKKSGKVTSSPAGPGGVLTSFHDGIQVLTDSLYHAIGHDNVIRDKEVINVYPELHDKWRIQFASKEELVADKVVIATPAYIASSLVEKLSPQLSTKLAEIKYSPLAVICLGYALEQINHDVNGFGYLFANNEEQYVLGTLWDSSIFANRAADGKVLLRSMLGGARNPEVLKLSDEELLKTVQASLNKTMQINVEPEMSKIFRHPQAIPQYNVGHREIVSQLEAMVASYTGLYLTGNAYYGVGINDCTLAAEKVAQQVLGI